MAGSGESEPGGFVSRAAAEETARVPKTEKMKKPRRIDRLADGGFMRILMWSAWIISEPWRQARPAPWCASTDNMDRNGLYLFLNVLQAARVLLLRKTTP
jgi:hypothetical protein